MGSRREFLAKGLSLGAFATSGCISNILVGCSRAEFDLILEGATVIDGTGKGPYAADIAVKGERIVAVGPLEKRVARRRIDVSGSVVAPGFIDVHSHTDYVLLINPQAESKIRQGVTTEICGNCGDSPFPLAGEIKDEFKKHALEKYGVDVEWDNLDGLFHRIEKNGSAVNFATLVGHGTVRGLVLGQVNRPPSDGELSSMKTLIGDSLEQGALGLSTGLEYTPGSFAHTNELIELCREVSAKDGVYATHIRNEDIRLEEAIDEALEISRTSGVKLQISHLKASQKRNWDKLPRVLETIASASEAGVPVHCDRYPYTAWATTMKTMFPLWSREGSTDKFISRLQSNSDWHKMRDYLIEKKDALGSWDAVLITYVSSEDYRQFQGKTINEISLELNKNPVELVRELLIKNHGKVGMCGFGMSEENTEKVLAFPLTMIGSDGSAWAPKGVLGQTHPHPRYYGTFPRVLGRYVRNRKITLLTEAIRKMTSLPADKFALKDRGRLEPNKFADMVVFDPATVVDKADFINPHQFPEGIDYVIVNGRIVVERGQHTGMLPGKVLRRT